MAGADEGLSQRAPTLRRAFVLIDARHGIKPVDDEILGLLDTSSAVPFQCVLTKADKVKARDRDPVLTQVRAALARHPAAYPRDRADLVRKGRRHRHPARHHRRVRSATMRPHGDER
jgi:GTP-binding protein EngB required for normal cell division